jgi:hypothetical protein
MPMPKATVDKQGNSPVCPREIRLANKWCMATPPRDVVFPQEQGKFIFGGSIILAADTRHQLRPQQATETSNFSDRAFWPA